MKTEKKKLSKRKKIILTVTVALVVAAAVTPAYVFGKQAMHKGNRDKYSVANVAPDPDSSLRGKTIIFLGSSVTYGSAAKGESFVDYLAVRDGINPVKEAVNGTTLVDNGKDSYVARTLTIDPSIHADAFVCQLSTNDASRRLPLGKVSDSFDLNDFDTQTVAGAIEYIIAYTRDTWDCPVVFYTGTKYENSTYADMVDLLLQIRDKWDIEVLDLWNDAEMNAVSTDDYKLYMVNGIHPSRAGYRDWWTPKFEAFLSNLLNDS